MVFCCSMDFYSDSFGFFGNLKNGFLDEFYLNSKHKINLCDMKKYLTLASLVLLASCSTPKYTYYFDHYNYASKKTQATASNQNNLNQNVIAIDENKIVASVDQEKIYVAETPLNPTWENKKTMEAIKALSPQEKRELKKEIKRYVKSIEKNPSIESDQTTNAMENDVKLAAIFGSVGIVLLIIGGEVLYVLGAVALLIGLYFFIRWLVHQ